MSAVPEGLGRIIAALILESMIAVTSGLEWIVVLFFMMCSWFKLPACAGIVLVVFVMTKFLNLIFTTTGFALGYLIGLNPLPAH
jgi:hypothetical protein